MYYDKLLAACPDFALEKSALQEMFEAHGHILIYSVPCHPGRSKKYFRHEKREFAGDQRFQASYP